MSSALGPCAFIYPGIQIILKIKNVTKETWDVEEADRFIKLALNFPELLTYEEERLWKIVTEYKPFWSGEFGEGEYGGINEESVSLKILRHNWVTFQKIVDGEAGLTDFSPVPF